MHFLKYLPLLPKNTQLDSHDALRYHWLCWRLTGIHSCTTHRQSYFAYSLLLNFCTTVLLIGLYIVSFFVQNDLDEELSNLSVIVPLIYTSAKQAIICYHIQKGSLKDAALYLQALDRQAEQRSQDINYLKQIVHRCQLIFTTALMGVLSCLILYAMVGILRHKLPFGGWMPFDWQHSAEAYTFVCAFQMFCFCVQTVYSVSSDTASVIYLLLLIAHLRILNARIARIGVAETEKKHNEEENYQQLAACVRDHWDCTHFYNCIRPAIGATIFIQFLSTAFSLCTAAITFITSDFSFSGLLKFVPYLLVVLLQVAPCCWFMDEDAAQMKNLTNSLFSCRWYEQSRRFRSALIIFMQRTQTVEKIVAGNIATVSLETFLGIIKFAFSLFTLLEQLKE